MFKILVVLALLVSMNVNAKDFAILKNKDVEVLLTNDQDDSRFSEYKKIEKKEWYSANTDNNSNKSKVYDKELYKYVETISLCIQGKPFLTDGLKETCLRVADGAISTSSAIFNLVESFKLKKEDLSLVDHAWAKVNTAAVNLKMAIENNDYSYGSYMGWSCLNILLIYKTDPELFKSKPSCKDDYLNR